MEKSNFVVSKDTAAWLKLLKSFQLFMNDALLLSNEEDKNGFYGNELYECSRKIENAIFDGLKWSILSNFGIVENLNKNMI